MAKLALALLLFVAAACAPITPPRIQTPDGSSCTVVHVVDGDTITIRCRDGLAGNARLIGFDTPETRDAGCAAEARQGHAAKHRLGKLLRDARQIEIEHRGRDRYDRLLLVLKVDGKNVGDTLIAEGLAVPYNGGKRIDWCDRLAARPV